MTPVSNKDVLRVEDWNGEMGQRWLRHLDTFENMIEPVGKALLARAEFRPGERVVDIGCGGGASTRVIARTVAPDGIAVGVDIAQCLVDEAARRARRDGTANVRFVAGDATNLSLSDAPFDRLHSRFGVMFFAEPLAAFRNLGGLVRAGGRADFAVWAPARDNPWVSAVIGVMRRHVDLPVPEPRAPGPFALDDRTYFAELLHGGGFTGLDFHQWRGTQWIGGEGANPPRALDFLLNAMSLGDAVTEQPADVRSAIESELLELFRARQSTRGVGMEAVAWLVSAQRAG